VVSCIGHDKQTVTSALKAGRSGISFKEQYKEMGLRSNVAGQIDIDPADLIDRKHLRFMGNAAAYAYIAMQRAIEDSALKPEQVSNPRTGIIIGSGGVYGEKCVETIDAVGDKGVKRAGAARVNLIVSAAVFS